MADIETRLLAELAERQTITNSSEYATLREVAHDKVVGVIKSLQAAELIEAEVILSQVTERRYNNLCNTKHGLQTWSTLARMTVTGAEACKLCADTRGN